MGDRTLGLDDLENRTLIGVLREVVARQEVLTMRLPEGETVLIQPIPRLKPLRVPKGFVPAGWKDKLHTA